jgi:hypothetical protein
MNIGILGAILGFVLCLFIDAICLGYRPKWYHKLRGKLLVHSHDDLKINKSKGIQV